MPDLVGRVLLGDFATARSFPATSNKVDYAATTDHTDHLDPAPRKLEFQLSSFAIDLYGEVYVTAFGFGGSAGQLYRIELE